MVLVVDGDPAGLPAAVDISAYRIVQEALTNVLKHAGQASAQVNVRCGADVVQIEVTDDGAGPQAGGQPGAGHGLAGMRERVALFGGELTTGPRPGGGFAVRARLPLGEQPRPAGSVAMSPVISVLIADDQDLVREGLRMLLPGRARHHVATDDTGSEAITAARKLDPDVVLMDVRMPGMDGIEAAAHLIRAGQPRPDLDAHHVRP